MLPPLMTYIHSHGVGSRFTGFRRVLTPQFNEPIIATCPDKSNVVDPSILIATLSRASTLLSPMQTENDAERNFAHMQSKSESSIPRHLRTLCSEGYA